MKNIRSVIMISIAGYSLGIAGAEMDLLVLARGLDVFEEMRFMHLGYTIARMANVTLSMQDFKSNLDQLYVLADLASDSQKMAGLSEDELRNKIKSWLSSYDKIANDLHTFRDLLQDVDALVLDKEREMYADMVAPARELLQASQAFMSAESKERIKSFLTLLWQQKLEFSSERNQKIITLRNEMNASFKDAVGVFERAAKRESSS